MVKFLTSHNANEVFIDKIRDKYKVLPKTKLDELLVKAYIKPDANNNEFVKLADANGHTDVVDYLLTLKGVKL